MKNVNKIRAMLDGDTVDFGDVLVALKRGEESPISTTPTRYTPPPKTAKPAKPAKTAKTAKTATVKAEKADHVKKVEARRKRIVNFIERYFATHFRAPTVREIRAGAGIDSISMVVFHMRALVKSKDVIDTGEHGESRRYVPAWLPDAVKREMQSRRGCEDK